MVQNIFYVAFLSTLCLAGMSYVEAKESGPTPIGSDYSMNLRGFIPNRGSENIVEQCKDILNEYCGECFQTLDSFGCLKQCITDKHDDIIKAGCPFGDDEDHHPPSNHTETDCKELVEQLCGNCTSSDHYHVCKIKCTLQSRKQLEQAGCSPFKQDDILRFIPDDVLKCGEEIKSLCGNCTKEENGPECVKTCIQDHQDELKESGCVFKPDPSDIVKKCKDLTKSLCSSCDTAPFRAFCMVKCFRDKMDEFEEAGCKLPVY